jgi:hypothetical protein
MSRFSVACGVAVCLSFGLTLVVEAQDAAGLFGALTKIDPLTLFSPDDPVLTDPAANVAATSTPPKLPPGSKFKLLGNAADARDPQNFYNEVISTNPQLLPPLQQTPDCTPYCGPFGSAYKKFGDHVKIAMLTNMLNVKYYFPNPSRTCTGGSPRVQLGIDGDGNGKFEQYPGGPDQNAFGYVGHGPFGSGCVSGMWDIVDLSDAVPARWDLSQFGLGYHTWQTAVTALTAAYPAHQVLNAILVDDSGWAAGGSGCAYYDVFTAGARTLDTWDDTSDPGKQPNGCP